jgi:hypothetical protein
MSKQQNLESVAGAIGSAGGIIALVWAWVLRQRAALARTEATVAEERAATSVADAQSTTFALLRDRQIQLEEKLKQLEDELEAERAARRAAEEKLATLTAWLKHQGLTPPEL